MIISFLASTIVILLISLNSNFFGNKLCLLDKPTKDKIHKKRTPLLGGLIIFTVLIIFLIFNHKNDDNYLFPFIFMFTFFTLGIIDDRTNLTSNYKILFTIIFSVILILSDESFLIHKIFFEISNNELYFGKFKIPVTLFCILLLYIAINMSDGINCLLITISIFAIITINFLIANMSLNLFDISILFSLIFLVYFNYKNMIFLGNSGASILAAYFIYKLININYFIQIDVFKVVSIFLILGLDMVRLVIIRLYQKKNPFKRDLNHFHYLLLKKFSLIHTIIIYLILSFSPIIFSNLIKISIIYFVPFQILIYSTIIYKLK